MRQLIHLGRRGLPSDRPQAWKHSNNAEQERLLCATIIVAVVSVEAALPNEVARARARCDDIKFVRQSVTTPSGGDGARATRNSKHTTFRPNKSEESYQLDDDVSGPF